MNLESRQFTLIGIALSVGLAIVLRLFYIQVVDSTWQKEAANISERRITVFPSRGLIFDRNGKLLVSNRPVYDLMVVPSQVNPKMDTLQFCELLDCTKAQFSSILSHAKEYSWKKASAFEKQIPSQEFAPIAEKLHLFPGFFGIARNLRTYPFKTAPHSLGYISEVTQENLNSDPYYKPGDYIGTRGLEKIYEHQLRGTRGTKYVVVDVHNNIVESYANEKFDNFAESGENVTTTLDIDLQTYGELLMGNKKGSIVAIEPKTGEILAMVSSPFYDPNQLVGRGRTKYFRELARNDSLNPLFNRAIMAQYRPGSIFKLVQSLIGLQEGVITPETRFTCNRNIIGCHGSHTRDDLEKAIYHSCNPYFYNVYKKLIQPGIESSIFKDSNTGLKNWKKHVTSFGFNQNLVPEFPQTKKGLVPGPDFYDNWYGHNRWAFSTIYSNSIGEGELGVVPVQMANLAAIIANKGHYITPHLLKSEETPALKRTSVDSTHFNLVQTAMQKVVENATGTAWRARTPGITVCGKTGTVQNGDLPDHSVFIAFAPREDPKIAIAVYVEYAGFGGTWSAPISSLMIEKYLTGTVTQKSKEKRILEAEFLKTPKPVKK